MKHFNRNVSEGNEEILLDTKYFFKEYLLKMREKWHNWCRLCANSDNEESDKINKMERLANHFEIVNKYFMISLLPFDGIESFVCEQCSIFLNKLDNFKDRFLKADQMFNELIAMKADQSSDLHSIRCKFGIDDNELKYSDILTESEIQEAHTLYSNDGIPDPLEEENICSVKEEDITDKESLQPKKKRKTMKRVCNKSTKNTCVTKNTSDIESEEIEENEEKFNLNGPQILCKNLINTKEDVKFEDLDPCLQSKDKPKEKLESHSLICEICSKSYKKLRYLEKHIQKYHINSNSTTRKSAHNTKEHMCSQCSKCFCSVMVLKRHEKTHLPESERNIFPCPYCDRKCSQKGNLDTHIRAIHRREKPFICEECGKSFVTKGALIEHQISHSEERTFECAICMKLFKNQPQLKRHEQIHKEGTLECPHCGVKRKTKDSLKYHMLVHSDVKKYKCQYCEMEFKRSKNLKFHLIMHTGQQPYKCRFCDLTFTYCSNRKKHERSSHKVKLAALEASGEKTKVTILPRLEELQRVVPERQASSSESMS